MSNHRQVVFVITSAVLLSAVVVAGAWHSTPASAGARNGARPIADGPVEGAPVVNYGIIWSEKLSRSGLPEDDDGWSWLRAQGINTIVNFRRDNDVDYGKFGFESFLWIPLEAGDPPAEADAEKFLRFVQDVDSQPVHLQDVEGKFHTGMMAALARYAIDGWSMDDALAETGLYLGSEELPLRQLDWLLNWAATHEPGSHRR